MGRAEQATRGALQHVERRPFRLRAKEDDLESAAFVLDGGALRGVLRRSQARGCVHVSLAQPRPRLAAGGARQVVPPDEFLVASETDDVRARKGKRVARRDGLVANWARVGWSRPSRFALHQVSHRARSRRASTRNNGASSWASRAGGLANARLDTPWCRSGSSSRFGMRVWVASCARWGFRRKKTPHTRTRPRPNVFGKRDLRRVG